MLQMIVLERSRQLTEEGLHFVGGFLQMRGGPARRRRRIIEFVRQARRHGAKGGELFPLLIVAFQIAQPCCAAL